MEFNLAAVFRAVAAAAPDRECVVWRDRRLTYADVDERTDRLARLLHDRGLGAHAERDGLAGHESGQDHLALYLHNGNEYLEGMLGSYKARVAPFNVNYRYVADELEYLLTDAGARGIVYHAAFAPTLDQVRDGLPSLELLLQVEDESGHDLLPGAIPFEDALAATEPEPPPVQPSPDDLYVLYTGGTTGMPKGVLWRQADIFVAALGGRRDTTEEWASLEEIAEAAVGGGTRLMPAPPFMHGAAHWVAFLAFTSGNTIVLPHTVERLDPADVWQTIEDEGVNALLMVGDAFGRPLLDAVRAGSYDASSVVLLISGGAPLSAGVKEGFLEELPHAMLLDAVGSSEAGSQGRKLHAAGAPPTTGTFDGLEPGACILSEDLARVLEPGSDEVGWLAQAGRVPLGYLGDPDKSARTFPVVEDMRYAVPGDRARALEGGGMELLGRDSVTINSGGEKIFAEEVEAALVAHPAVYDAVVVGRPSERWGQEVVAIVTLAEGASATQDELVEACGAHLARYKLPKAVILRDEIVRSPAGKADYRWAREVATAER